MICDNITVNKQGILCFAGVPVTELAKKYGTPLYIMDEHKIRDNCRVYTGAMKKYFESALPLYASKACAFKKIFNIIEAEGMGADVVSVGEIYTAMQAGMKTDNMYFHSNNKTDYDIEFAINNNVGYFVADNAEELKCIERTAAQAGIRQKVLLRLTPGIDTHTYEAVDTGKVDSKFGTAIETGQATEITKYALSLAHIEMMGFHCHIGSQVFDSDTFIRGAEIMLRFIAEIKEKFDFITKELSLGGGYGVRYTENDPHIDIAENIKSVSEKINEICASLHICVPKIIMEPGRSIVADAGMTVYTVGTIKEIPGYKNYVSIDGGMSDNPRFALYKSDYTVYVATRMNEPDNFTASVVGRCCESGDIIQENVRMPKPERGDLIAVCTTGAYNFSMASNYNRVGIPAVAMIKDGKAYEVVKRQSLDDIIANDL